MKFKTLIYSLFVLGLILNAVSCKNHWDEHYSYSGETKTAGVIAELATINQCSEFYDAVISLKIDTLIKSNFIYTILAPTNDNFDLSTIPENERKREVLMHFMRGKFISNQLIGYN